MNRCDQVLAKLHDVKQVDKGWKARCPAHDDKTPSLSISVGEDGRVLLCCHAGCTADAIVAALGLELRDLMPGSGDRTLQKSEKQEVSSPSPVTKGRKVHPNARSACRAALWSMEAKEASNVWEYRDLKGHPAGLVLRCDQPDGTKKTKPIARVPDGWVVGHMPESLTLEWSVGTPGTLVVDFGGRRPMLRIPAEAEKGNKDRLLPMAPEFAEFLAAIPEPKRHGRVFKLVGKRWENARMDAERVGRVVCRIGRKAGVVVDERERRLVVDDRRSSAKPKADEGRGRTVKPNDRTKRKYASAHDLRRAFGLRWSARVMPAVLQQLMRHESIETTMRYYVGRDADAVADTLWEAIESTLNSPKSDKSGNKAPNPLLTSAKEKPQPFVG